MIQIANSWSEIKVNQWVELVSLNKDDFDSNTSYLLEKLAIITDTSSDDPQWEDLEIKELNKILTSCKWLNQPIKTKLTQSVLDDKFRLKDFNKLSFGEYIDLDFYINDSPINNFTKIMAVLYRKWKLNEWDELVFEPYDFDMEKRNQIFSDVSIGDTYSTLNEFIKWKNDFIETYSTLYDFEADFEVEDELVNKVMEKHPELKNEMEEETKTDKLHKKWVWEQILLSLSNNDYTKFNTILDLNVVFVFNLLSMKKDLHV